ncbi:MAG: hypothetical protein ACSLFE_05685 [Gemmatimonadaceae bacterium]
MPVTAKLSRKFYEQLGDEIANELVEWFNAVDSDYKSDLKEINELNWNRFQAELQSGLDRHSLEIRRELGELRGELERRFAAIDTRFAKVDVQAAELRAELIKWMFLFWIGTVVPLGGLIVALDQASR